MTGDDLDRAHLDIALRLSTHPPHPELDWEQRAQALQGRLSVVQTYAYEGDRPSHSSVLCLAADAVALLVEVGRAEDADPVSEAA